MMMVNTRGNKALAFIMGLVYGYRNANFDLKVLPMAEFSQEKHSQDRCYFINKKDGDVFNSPSEGEYTCVCVIREDREMGKVVLFIYR